MKIVQSVLQGYFPILAAMLCGKFNRQIIYTQAKAAISKTTLFLPQVPLTVTKDTINLFRRWMYHECGGHGLFSDFVWLLGETIQSTMKANKLLRSVWMSLEDNFVEHELVKKWPSVRKILNDGLEALIRLGMAKTPDTPALALSLYIRTWGSIVMLKQDAALQLHEDSKRVLIETVGEQKVLQLESMLQDRSTLCTCSQDNWDLAQDILAFMQMQNESPEEPESPEQGDDDSQTGDDNNEPDPSASESNGEDDNNDDEGDTTSSDDGDDPDSSDEGDGEPQEGQGGNEDESDDSKDDEGSSGGESDGEKGDDDEPGQPGTTSSQSDDGDETDPSNEDKGSKPSNQSDQGGDQSSNPFDSNADVPTEVFDFGEALEHTIKEESDEAVRQGKPLMHDPKGAPTVARDNMTQYNAARNTLGATVASLMHMLKVVLKGKKDRLVAREEGRRIMPKHLSRIKTRNPSLFEHKVRKKRKPAKALTILVDHSGSMRRGRDLLAQQAVLAFSEVCSSLKINFEVLGFGSQNFNAGGLVEIKPFNSSYASCKGKLGGYINEAKGGTPMGEAMMDAFMRLTQQKADGHVMFVITDGAARNRKYAKEVAALIAESGVDLYGIGIQTQSVRNVFEPDKVTVITDINELGNQTLLNLQKAVA